MPEHVKRYDIFTVPTHSGTQLVEREKSDGAWVKHSNYAALEASHKELVETLGKALAFVEEELAVRRQSFMPDESPYIDEAVQISDAISFALGNAEKLTK